MPELISIPGVDIEDYYEVHDYGITKPQKLSHKIMSKLVEQQCLPADFLFRLLAFDEDERDRIGQTDVLAALGFGEPSSEAADYLHGRLPRCVLLHPYVNNRRNILSQLDEHYYIQADLEEAAEALGRMPYVARQSWDRYVQIADHTVYNKVTEVDERQNLTRRKRAYAYHLSRVVIRSDVLLDLYQNEEYTKQQGAIRTEILHYTLLDNYPEIAE